MSEGRPPTTALAVAPPKEAGEHELRDAAHVRQTTGASGPARGSEHELRGDRVPVLLACAATGEEGVAW
jgi:hypothetical protein